MRRFFKGSAMSTIGVAVLLVFVLFGIFGPMMAPYSATEMIAADARQGPSWQHLFGTDHLGRDVFSRVLYGTRSILGLTGSGAAIAVLLGALIGLFAGYRGGWADEMIMRLSDSLLSIPALLLALVLLGTIGPSSRGVLIVIAVVYTPIVTRVVRSETLALRRRGFVETARIQGEPLWRILVGEILPSVLPVLSVEAALRFSYAIFLVAALGFLGVGVQPPTPDWGLMVKEARIFIGLTPWALFFPAGAISLLVISVNLAADGLKRSLQGEEMAIGRRARRLVTKTRTAASARCDRPEERRSLLPLAHFEELTVSYFRDGLWSDAVRDVSFDVNAGETYGLVGESGSGKSTLALAIVGYLAENGAVREGSVCVRGRSVKLHAPTRRSRNTSIAFVAQDALASLNPAIRIGRQIGEVLRRQRHATRSARDEIHTLLRHVELRDAERIARHYPHELSGGMLQRVALAMALAMEPDLLILDEPTTGLDVTTQAAILALLREIRVRRRHATLHISHDLDVIFAVSDRVGVLYAGEMVEEAAAAAL
ncbi:dipeptide/oligopeptide/nickel ABC transporter permease/ATP-binding protein, partial [Candidatus Bipolaricaulota bacterium]|nr:dipeptide/oligopeptide/nickel ABC transporter permease/ATP-binding protein [Candidatus Bipolaricaulota bacterium]